MGGGVHKHHCNCATIHMYLFLCHENKKNNKKKSVTFCLPDSKSQTKSGTWTLSCFCAQDGGLLINNPTALAVHECKCLWPDTPLECVVSLGTGRMESLGKTGTTSTSLKTKLNNVISSATDTEGE